MASQTPVPGCTRHPGKGFVYVCKTCNNDLICMDCVLDRHNKHELGSLTEYVSKQTLLIQQYEGKLTKTDRMLGTVFVDGENQSFRPVPPSFHISFPYTDVRTCRKGDEAWLSNWDDEQIYRVDQQGNIKKKIECKVKVESIAVSPTTGRVWFCVREDKSIREITSDGGIVIRFNVESDPLSLCITQDDMVVVGLLRNGIVLYTSDGRKVEDEDGRVCRKEAVIPWYMAYCTKTGDVAVSDNDGVRSDNYMAGMVRGKQPRLIVMDKHLKLKFQCWYIDGIGSQTGGSQQSKFYPTGVCFDRDGDVLVAEGVTRSVLLIDGNTGHYLRTVYISDGGILFSISLQCDDMLWIKHGEREMKVVKYLK